MRHQGPLGARRILPVKNFESPVDRLPRSIKQLEIVRLLSGQRHPTNSVLRVLPQRKILLSGILEFHLVCHGVSLHAHCSNDIVSQERGDEGCSASRVAADARVHAIAEAGSG